MDEVRCGSPLEIARYLERWSGIALFRGQARHYQDHLGTSLSSSFSRLGCVPHVMMKWAHYAQEVCRALQGPGGRPVEIEYSQAILQHYGWRSFFIDLSESVAVAAWFAGNRYVPGVVLEVSEDCHEAAVLLMHDTGSYEEADGEGHLYVIPKASLAKLEVGMVDLASVPYVGDGRLRFHAQRAWLAGPLKTRLPSDCIAAHVVAPAAAFRECAAAEGAASLNTLFPRREEDVMLALLLSAPWELAPDRGSKIELYVRSLRLPEYDLAPHRTYDAKVAFYRPFWISEDRGPEDSPFRAATFLRAPSEVLFGRRWSEVDPLPHLYGLLSERGSVVIETNGLVAFPESLGSVSYGKGIMLKLGKPGVVEVAGVCVEHPGCEISGVGVSLGWFYKVLDDGRWSRISCVGECPCNNPMRHEHHMAIAKMVDQLLRGGEFTSLGQQEMLHKSLLITEVAS